MIPANASPSLRDEAPSWQRAVSVLCMLILLLPTASWLPASLMLQFRLGSEEEVETVGETLGETTEVRRKPLKSQKAGRPLVCRPTVSVLPLAFLPTADRSEYCSVNGTGALLRC